MKTIRNVALTLVLLSLCCLSCNENKPISNKIDYADTTYWYSYGDSWFVDITLPEVREEANENQRFNKMLYSDYNFYAPYYRQMIFEAYLQPMDSLQRYAEIAALDVIDAFQYYMEHFNGGRPFFLMGHSQGSQMLIELLKHGMTDEQTGGHLEDHFMICTDVDPGMVYIEAYKKAFPYGNLHLADSWLFGGNVVENMRCRLRNFE